MMNITAPSVLQQFPLISNLGQVGSGFFLVTRTDQQQQDQEEATPEQQQQEEVAGERGSSSWQRHQEERHQFTDNPFRIPAEDASRTDTRCANCIVLVVIWAPLFLSMILPSSASWSYEKILLLQGDTVKFTVFPLLGLRL